ncbi:MAG TPA: hypothetical protein VM238_18635 [Phycisphaerae bacterium]|nr:hypothetical protein [Phycisphaerae bacterium]
MARRSQEYILKCPTCGNPIDDIDVKAAADGSWCAKLFCFECGVLDCGVIQQAFEAGFRRGSHDAIEEVRAQVQKLVRMP